MTAIKSVRGYTAEIAATSVSSNVATPADIVTDR